MSVSLRHDGLKQKAGEEKAPTRFNLKDVVRRAGDGKDITARERDYLLFSIERCTDEDFQKGAICAHWVNPKEIAKQLRCTPRQINTIERSLEEKNYIVRTFGGNGRRYGNRPRQRITLAAGINLAPLIGRYSELVELSEALDREDDAIECMRAEIQLRRREIRSTGDAVAIAKCDAILPRGRTSEINDFDRLHAILSALNALYATLPSKSGRVKTSTWSDESSSRSEISDQPHIQEPDSETIPPPRNVKRLAAITDEQVMLLATPGYRWLVECLGGPSPQNFAAASRATASNLHFRPGTFDWMCRKMGSDNAALAVLIIDRNSQLPEGHPFHRENPGGSAVGMASRWSDAEFDGRDLLNLLRAIQGYPAGEAGNVVLLPQTTGERPPSGATMIGDALARILPGIAMNVSEHQL